MSELGNFDAKGVLKPTTISDDDKLNSLTDVDLESLLERDEGHLMKFGAHLPDKGDKSRLRIACVQAEMKRREMISNPMPPGGIKKITSGVISKPNDTDKAMPDAEFSWPDNISVPDSLEGDDDCPFKKVVLKDVENFEERLSDARVFMLDIRTLKDQIRAIVRCFRDLVCDFDLARSKFCGVEQEGLGLTHAETESFSSDSEKLTCDELRSNAYKLFKFFRDTTLVTFLSLGTEEALQVIQATVKDGDLLVYRVMYQGFDCRNHSEDEHDDNK